MDKSDVEMEDTENHPRDSGSHVKESENNSKEENSPPATAVVEDEQIIGNGGEDHTLSRNEPKDNKVMSLMKYQISPNSEASDPMIAEGSVDEQFSTKIKDEEIINSKTHFMTEAVEQNPANCGLKEEKRTEKGMDFGNHANNVEEKLSQCKAEKPNEFGITDAS